MSWIQKRAPIDKMAKLLIEQQAEAFNKQIQIEAGKIVERTQSGKDAEGQPFKPYSPEYLKYKKSKGRSGSVDLTFSSAMLNSIKATTRINGNLIEGTISIGKTEEAKARGNLKLRKFFALGKDQLKRLSDAVKKAAKL